MVQHFLKSKFYDLLNLLLCSLFTLEIHSSNSENSSNLDDPTSSGSSGHHVDEWDVDPVSGEELVLTEMSSVRFDAREQLLTPEIQEEPATCQYGE